MRDAAAVGDAVGGIVTFASDLGPALVGLACALAALLLLLFLCVRTRLRRQQQRQCAPPLLADNVSEAQRSRLLELQFYMRSCMDYRALRLLPHVGAHEEQALQEPVSRCERGQKTGAIGAPCSPFPRVCE